MLVIVVAMVVGGMLGVAVTLLAQVVSEKPWRKGRQDG